jgi:hypothetical protein
VRKVVRWQTGAEECPRVIVECDGHEYHDKTPEQARRDKGRDRFLQAQGYHVLRFTGSELVRSATRCAGEVDRAILRLDGQRRAARYLAGRGKPVLLGGWAHCNLRNRTG